jgi:putative tricarboxylic transport membrane protein
MKTLKDFLDPLKADPKAFPIVGGRSDDRVFYGLMFEKAGIDPTQINYVAYAGGGESIAALLEGTPKAMITTVGEAVGALRSNQIRLLAFSAAKRPATGDLSKVPTLREAGLDFDWQNFRYAMGGPDMPKDAVKFWQDTFAKMSKSPAWKQKLEQYNWSDEYMVDGLDAYLAETQEAVLVGLRRLGMAKR